MQKSNWLCFNMLQYATGYGYASLVQWQSWGLCNDGCRGCGKLPSCSVIEDACSC